MEIWELYDEQGNKTGETWERSRAYEIPEGRYHIVCDILVRHQDGKFLLTLRDSRKEMYPGCWEASAGGSALAGETPEVIEFSSSFLSALLPAFLFLPPLRRSGFLVGFGCEGKTGKMNQTPRL